VLLNKFTILPPTPKSNISLANWVISMSARSGRLETISLDCVKTAVPLPVDVDEVSVFIRLELNPRGIITQGRLLAV
jgi:hypothetical protein